MLLAMNMPNKNSASQLPGFPQKRLVWMMLLRVVLISVLLGATIILNYRGDEPYSGPSLRFLLSLIAVTYLITIIYALWYRTGKGLVLLGRLQLALDLCFWGCLAYATGGIVSGFTFLFDLWVIVSAVVFGGRAAYYTAAGSLLILILLTATMYAGVLEPLSDQLATEISLKEIAYFLAVNMVALFIVAVLVNSLVARLESTGLGLEAERARRADLAQLHTDMIRSLTVGIVTTSKTGEVFTMNPAGLELLGMGLSEVEGQPLGYWLPEMANRSIRDSAMLTRGNSTAINVDGTHVPIEYLVAPLLSAESMRLGSIVVFSDLTEVRRLQAEVERTRQLAALGELAASLAHEIRNPLGAVSGAFQMIASQPDFKEEDRSLVDIITREIRRMERLIGDMLNYARPRQADFATKDIGKLIDEVVKIFRMGQESAGRSIEIEKTGQIEAEVDHSYFKQVVWNLLRNAAQATEPGDSIKAIVSEHGDSVLIEVIDKGCGIASEDQEKIFDPFFSTRERGLGIGLALCKRIIDEHKGEITVKSQIGTGTTFRIVLPKKASINKGVLT